MTSTMEKVFTIGLMGIDMREIGLMEKETGKEFIIMIAEKDLKENTKIVKLMGRACFIGRMGIGLKESSEIIWFMEKTSSIMLVEKSKKGFLRRVK